MRTLLSLYPGSSTLRREQMRRHGPWLRERGVRVVLADDWLEPQDADAFAEVVRLPPPGEVAAAVDALAAVPCDAVLVQSEAAVLPGALLCAQRGLPGIAPEAALACVGKHVTRAALARAGVAQPAFALADGAAGVRRFAAGQYPVVLKGVASAMSRLVTLVRSPADVDGAVAHVLDGLGRSMDIARLLSFCAASGLDPQLDPRRTFLVEQFAAGAPVEVDGLVVDGEAQAFGVLAQVLTPPPLFYIDGYLLPSGRSDAAAIHATALAALAALGLRHAGFAIELRATAAGPVIIEVNGRLGEDDGYGDLFAAATGTEPFRHGVELALGGAPRVGSAGGGFHALAYQNWFGGGTVASVPDLADLVAATGIRLGLTVGPGSELLPAPHPDTFPHLAWALASDPGDPRAAYLRARAAVTALAFSIK